MKRIALHWQIIIGLFLGIIWAVAASYLGWSEFTLNWINPFGSIFINLLKMIAVPLVLFSIIKGIANLSDVSKLGRLSAKTLFTYLITTVIAVTLGLSLVNVINPGGFISEEQRMTNRENYIRFVARTEGVDVIDNRQVLSDSVLQEIGGIDTAALQEQPGNNVVMQKKEQAEKLQEQGPLQFLVDIVPGNIFVSLNDNTLMLQVIFFAIFFGITLILIPATTAKPVIEVVDGFNAVFLKMVDIVMQAAPFFVFALLAGKMSELSGDDPSKVIDIFYGLGWYSLTVIIGLALMVFVFYPIVIRIFTKDVSYTGFFRGIGPAQLLAFSTSSSAATLPVTMDCVRENLGVSKEITSFVLPIGATVNMDGTSLYQAVAVVFLAQFHFVDLTIAQQLTIVLTATLASIGSAAVPGAGLVMLIMVLNSVGLDPEWIAIILPVDRILDMCRTVVNVTGDAAVATAIARSEGELHYVEQEQIDNFEI